MFLKSFLSFFATLFCRIRIIFKQIYFSHRWYSNDYYQSESGSNGNEEIFHTAKISKTRTLPLDTVYCHANDTPFFSGGRGSYSSSEDTIYERLKDKDDSKYSNS